MKKIILWRPEVAGENWMQTLFRMLGNLVQWFVAIFLLYCLLIIILDGVPSADERYAAKVNIELEFINRPENPSWKFDKVGDSSYTYNEFIPKIIERGFSSPIRTPQTDKDCSLVAPLLVTLKNTGKKTVGNVVFTLSARKQGRSTDVLPSTDSVRSLDFIIAPSETLQRCLPVSADLSNDLIWKAKVSRVATQ